MSAISPQSASDRSASHPLLRPWLARSYPAVMGILNVTPDSFSDGGRFNAPERAIEQAKAMIAAGADIIDIGAESTRPYTGAEPVSAEEELARLRPVLPAVIALGVPVSIDSMKSQVVTFAIEAGAVIANDVWGLQRDPGMAEVVAAHGAPVVVMHNRADVDPQIDIIDDMLGFFRALARHRRQGWRPHRQHRARSRHRLRQDCRAEHESTGAARLIRALRIAAAGWRLAQTLHQHAGGVGAAAAARRINRGTSDRGSAWCRDHQGA